MKRTTLQETVFITGILSAVCYLLHDIIGNLTYPGYNIFTQAVSDLTAANAPSRVYAQPFSSLYGLFSLICTLGVCILNKENTHKTTRYGLAVWFTMNLISAAGYTLFPLSESGTPDGFQNVMHIVVTVLVVLTSIISLLLLAMNLKRGDKTLGTMAVLALLCMMFGAIGSNALPKSMFGIVERFSTYSAVVFTAFLGIQNR